ncbi:MAG: threonine synthase [Capsulimonadales bacterium]|nr:threonine synthase [Capsulimonadales bacterium]
MRTDTNRTGRQGIIAAYRDFLPDITAESPVVTLCEGGTPLIEAPRLATALELPANFRLYLKFEGMNPTGSFKDRGMTMAVSKAVEEGRTVVMCASTGNTSAAAAAYAARAGIECVVLLPQGEVALGKLSQALMHGARVLAIRGNFDEALCLVREICATEPIALVNSVNPVRIEGQKTAAFEIVDELGDAPHFHAMPVGNAGNITAYWKGFKEFFARGLATRTPRLLGFQAAGAAPLVDGAPVPFPNTVATAIRIGNPASWQGALTARDESGGLIGKVTDEEILAAYRTVAATEGVFAEPACAAPLAGIKALQRDGFFTENSTGDDLVRITVTLTGHGLKDPDRALRTAVRGIQEVDADRDAILRAVGEKSIDLGR